jgi:hypothetical protein
MRCSTPCGSDSPSASSMLCLSSPAAAALQALLCRTIALQHWMLKSVGSSFLSFYCSTVVYKAISSTNDCR